MYSVHLAEGTIQYIELHVQTSRKALPLESWHATQSKTCQVFKTSDKQLIGFYGSGQCLTYSELLQY